MSEEIRTDRQTALRKEVEQKHEALLDTIASGQYPGPTSEQIDFLLGASPAFGVGRPDYLTILARVLDAAKRQEDPRLLKKVCQAAIFPHNPRRGECESLVLSEIESLKENGQNEDAAELYRALAWNEGSAEKRRRYVEAALKLSDPKGEGYAAARAAERFFAMVPQMREINYFVFCQTVTLTASGCFLAPVRRFRYGHAITDKTVPNLRNIPVIKGSEKTEYRTAEPVCLWSSGSERRTETATVEGETRTCVTIPAQAGIPECTYAEGTGLVRVRTAGKEKSDIFELCESRVLGGTGLLPLAEGNVWRYRPTEGPEGYDTRIYREIVSTSDSGCVMIGIDYTY